MYRNSLALPSALALCALAAAQQQVQAVRVTAPVKNAGTYHYASGTWTRAGQSAALGPDVIYSSTVPSGYFGSGWEGSTGVDEGILPGPTNPDFGPNDAYYIDGFRFSYCSADVSVDWSWFLLDSYVPCDLPYSPTNCINVASQQYDLIGMPGGGCWTVTIDLSGGFEACLEADGGVCAPGYQGAGTGLDHFGIAHVWATPSGATTGPILGGYDPAWAPPGQGTCYNSSTTCASGNTGLGALDQFAIEGGALVPGCYDFGGYFNFNGCGNPNAPAAQFHFELLTNCAATCAPGLGDRTKVVDANTVFHRLYIRGDDEEYEESLQEDLDDLKEVLEKPGNQANGSTSRTLAEPTIAEVCDAMAQMALDAEDGEMITIYITAHGGTKTFADAAEGNEPTDHDQHVRLSPTRRLKDDEFADKLEQYFPNNPTTVMLNSCYGGGFTGGLDDTVEENDVKVIGARGLLPIEPNNDAFKWLVHTFTDGIIDALENGAVTGNDIKQELDDDFDLGRPAVPPPCPNHGKQSADDPAKPEMSTSTTATTATVSGTGFEPNTQVDFSVATVGQTIVSVGSAVTDGSGNFSGVALDISGFTPPVVVLANDHAGFGDWNEVNHFGGGGSGSCSSAVYCDGPNQLGTISVSDCALSANPVLTCSQVTGGLFAYFNISASNGVVTDPPGSFGDLCLVGSPIGRYVADLQTVVGGSFSTDLVNGNTGGGNANLPTPPGGTLDPGETWNFQAWVRVTGGSRWTPALEITFD